MGKQEEQAQRQRRKQPPADSAQLQKASPNAWFVAIAAGAVLLPLAHRLGWLDVVQDAVEDALGISLPWRQDGDNDDDDDAPGGRHPPGKSGIRGDDGSRSAFTFPPVKKGSAGGSQVKKGNAKKLSRQQRQQRRAEREDKRRPALVPGGVGTLPEGAPVSRSVPKDEEYVGGEQGTTLVTNSRYYTSAMDKRVAEEARAAVRFRGLSVCMSLTETDSCLPLPCWHSQKALLR